MYIKITGILVENLKFSISISDFDEYYTEDNGFSYFPCYAGVSNCKKCTSKNVCTKCQENYCFIGNNTNICVNKNNLNLAEYYTLDEGISYFPCIEPINCLGCQDN